MLLIKKITILQLMIQFLLLFSNISSYAQFTYDASTLHNAASRSQTVEQFFFQRWNYITNNYLRFDAYININWVHDFYVNSYNHGTGKTEATPMRLIRTFSDLIVLFPLYTPEQSATPDEFENDNTNASVSSFRKPWDNNTFLIGFTACGYHYGLTRTTRVNRGYAGRDLVSDYAFSQFFDDIFALTLMFTPYITLHSGVILNQQLEPEQDGTLDYTFNPSGIKRRYFISINIFDSVAFQSTAVKNNIESSDINVTITKLFSIIHTLPEFIPDITLGYKYFKKFNDEPYDAVWVHSAIGKSNIMLNAFKNHATLYSFYTVLEKKFFNTLYIEANVELQHVDATLIDKRSLQKITLPYLRTWLFRGGYDFLDSPGWDMLLWIGVSGFYDPSVSYHSNHKDNKTIGYCAMIDLSSPYVTFSLKASYNDSIELEKLVEAVDKFIVEGSASFRI